MDLFYTPTLCILGLVGNSLSLAVFCFHFNHKNLSSSYYLASLAATDSGFLLTVLINWLDSWWDLGINTTAFTCPLTMYLAQVTSSLSVWLIVAFTVERYFAVCHPMRNTKLNIVWRAKKVILGLVFCSLVLFSYVWIIAKPIIHVSIEHDDGFDNSTNCAVSNGQNGTEGGQNEKSNDDSTLGE